MKKCSVDGCEKHARTKGVCTAHYLRMRRHGTYELDITPRGAPQQFLAEVIASETDDCILWPFAKSRYGDGRIGVNGQNRPVQRIICETFYGPAEDGMMSGHLCASGRQGCVNPRHLRWVTSKQNQMDRVAHGTSNRGSRCAAAKFSEDDARTIKSRLFRGEKCASLAREYNVNFVTIHDIKNKRSWAWLSE